MRSSTRAAAAISAVVLALFLASCAPGKGSGPSATTPAPAASAPAIGILVGTSPVDHELNQARAWAADAWLVAKAAGRSGAHVVIDRFGPGPGSSEVMYNARVTSTTGQNTLIISMQISAAEKRMTRSFDDEQGSATPGPVNLISGVSSMAQHLHVFPHKTTDVVIFGDADETAGPVNLVDPLQLADPNATLQAVVSKGLLRHGECLGWRVYMVDGSLTPAGGLSALQDEQLREFWREFFARCGGALVVWDNTLITFPASGQIAPASWAAPGHQEIIVSLPSSVLFRPNGAVLLPGAAQILDKLAGELTVSYPRATAGIAGYTAAVTVPGPTARSLSLARAQAVAAYLEARGVRASRLAVHGYGGRHQIATDATAAGQARNRRVVVTLHPMGLRSIRDPWEHKK